ncbi:AAA family ATPase [Antricoccus suffuscus]|nr:AAA family ATPase [Antricoccus suffuscus]
MTLTAFGPYAGTETIDFDVLSRDGLFLFTGPTGAGKTTILDAVAFALFGQLPGARKNLLNKIRSDHADHSVAPQVILECTLAGERVRLTRRPAYDRPAKRGGGTTTERASVALETMADGAWVGVENGNREGIVADWIHERIGLNCEQFMQVVLLPQGEFAKFLQAGDRDREQLLRSLFDASRFAAVEDWFDNREKAEREALREHESAILELRAEARTIAQVDVADVPDEAGVEWLSGLVTKFGARAEALVAQQEQAERDLESTQSALTAAERVMELQRKLHDARELSRRVESQRETVDRQRARLSLARKASSVVPLLERQADSEAARQVAGTDLEKATSVLLERRPEAPVSSAAKMASEAAAVRTQLGSLDEALANEDELPAYTKEAADAAANVAEASAIAEEISRRRTDLPEEIKKVNLRLTELTIVAGQQTAARQAVETAQAATAAALEVQTLQRKFEELTEATVEAKRSALEAKETWLLLRERRLDGMAAELAGQLAVGDACLVCGSLEHPRPAVTVASTPTKDDEAAAQKSYEDADLALTEASSSLGTVGKKLGTAQGKMGSRSAKAWTAELASAKMRLAEAVAADAELARVRREHEQLEKQLADATSMLEDATANLTAHRSAQQRAEQSLRTRQDRVAKARDGFESVAERAADLSSLALLYDAVIGGLSAVAQADKSVRSATNAARSAAKKAGFDSSDAATEASLDADTEATIATDIEQFDVQSTRARTLLDDPDFAGLTDQPPPIEALAQDRDDAKELLQQVQTALSDAVKARDGLRKVLRSATTVLAQGAEAHERYAVVRDLASVIRGQGANTKAMHLTAYFLAARLEQVAEVASSRLLKMSKGRYSLVHSDERLKKRGAGGLGLQVMDAHTGIARPTQTLSGGESFLASLALALGLAEVVTQEAGANTLDSLFVDEGFGALDSETLEQAMSVLDELRSGGRTIGLISHVDELKVRVANQLVVSSGERGSHITINA